MKFSVLNTLFAQLASGEDRVLWDGLDQSGRNAMLELLTRTDAERTIVILCENDTRPNRRSWSLQARSFTSTWTKTKRALRAGLRSMSFSTADTNSR